MTVFHSQKQRHTIRTTLRRAWLPGMDGVIEPNTAGVYTEMDTTLHLSTSTLNSLTIKAAAAAAEHTPQHPDTVAARRATNARFEPQARAGLDR
jgi:hypothetical protein